MTKSVLPRTLRKHVSDKLSEPEESPFKGQNVDEEIRLNRHLKKVVSLTDMKRSLFY